MSLFKLAYSNFKRSVKNYVALIISLSFSIFTFFNFQNIVFSNAMDVLKEKNSDYIAIIIQVISIVLIIIFSSRNSFCFDADNISKTLLLKMLI